MQLHAAHRIRPLSFALAAGLIATLALPSAAPAAEARTAVKPKPGEIVLLRDVPTRPAVRMAPPGMALIVDPTPNRQLDTGLGAMELSDGETAAIGAPVQRATGLIGAALGTSSPGAPRGGADPLSTPRGAAPHAPPLGAVGNATRGVGSQITGALQALPFGKPAGG